MDKNKIKNLLDRMVKLSCFRQRGRALAKAVVDEIGGVGGDSVSGSGQMPSFSGAVMDWVVSASSGNWDNNYEWEALMKVKLIDEVSGNFVDFHTLSQYAPYYFFVFADGKFIRTFETVIADSDTIESFDIDVKDKVNFEDDENHVVKLILAGTNPEDKSSLLFIDSTRADWNYLEPMK